MKLPVTLQGHLKKYNSYISFVFVCFLMFNCSQNSTDNGLQINELEYFESRGINYLVFSNAHSDYFGDSKMSGLEIIHHEIRTATNGDVRLHNTPEQWDDIPTMIERVVNKDANSIEIKMAYPEYNFEYTIITRAEGMNMIVTVDLQKPLPENLVGKAGFNRVF